MPNRANSCQNETACIKSNQEVAVVIPSYNEEESIFGVVKEVCEMGYQVIVVNDGSMDATAKLAGEAGALVISHSENKGKGAALNTGYGKARELGCKVVVAMDGDGQHLPGDIPTFIEAYNRTKIPVIIGNRLLDKKKMPFIRREVNLFMSRMLCRSMGQYIPDTQCGFRLFRCDVIPYVKTITVRYEAESEILLHVASRRIQMGWVRVSTVYGNKKKSNINPLRDTIRFLRMFFKYSRKRRSH